MREHEIEIRVRYNETDAMGYLHHGNYLAYFEMGRTELFRAQGGNYREMEERKLFFVVAAAEIRYRQPARYDDLLRLRTTIETVTPAKLIHRYELYRDKLLLAEARITLACVDGDGKIIRIPQVIPELAPDE